MYSYLLYVFQNNWNGLFGYIIILARIPPSMLSHCLEFTLSQITPLSVYLFLSNFRHLIPLYCTQSNALKLTFAAPFSILPSYNYPHPNFVSCYGLLFSSDDFVQAQQQLARWASEDVVSVVVRAQPGSDPTPTAATAANGVGLHSLRLQSTDHTIHGDSICTTIPSSSHPHHTSTTISQCSSSAAAAAASALMVAANATTSNTMMHHSTVVSNGTNLSVGPRDFYPSPPSTTETESSGSLSMRPVPPLPPVRRTAHLEHHHQPPMAASAAAVTGPSPGVAGVPSTETSGGRYPEYKH